MIYSRESIDTAPKDGSQVWVWWDERYVLAQFDAQDGWWMAEWLHLEPAPTLWLPMEGDGRANS